MRNLRKGYDRCYVVASLLDIDIVYIGILCYSFLGVAFERSNCYSNTCKGITLKKKNGEPIPIGRKGIVMKEVKKEVVIDLERAESILNAFDGRFEEGKKAVRFACETLAKEMSECNEDTQSYITDELKRRFDKSTVSQMLTAGRYWLSHTDCNINEYSRVYLIAKFDDKELSQIEGYLDGKIADSSFRELKHAISCFKDDSKAAKSGKRNHEFKWCPVSESRTTYRYEIQYFNGDTIKKATIHANSDANFTARLDDWKHINSGMEIVTITRVTTSRVEIEYR